VRAKAKDIFKLVKQELMRTDESASKKFEDMDLKECFVFGERNCGQSLSVRIHL
jgi:hypothetical protein